MCAIMMRVSRYHGATISSRKLRATISSYSEVRDDTVRRDHTIRAQVAIVIGAHGGLQFCVPLSS